MKRIFTAMLMALSLQLAFGANPGHHELQIKTDNDFFVPFGNTDQYYTFGQKFIYRFRENRYHHLTQLPARLLPFENHQTIIAIEIGQEAYTPGNYDSQLYRNYDRPFAGWSYVASSVNYVYERQLFSMGITVGTLGPASLAGQVQNYFHEQIIDNSPLKGWEYQVDNRMGVNLRAAYHRSLASSGWSDITWDNDAAVGTEMIYLHSGGTLRIGKFNPINQTIAYQTSITSGQFEPEIFIALSGGFKLTAYNATLQQSTDRQILIWDKEANNLTTVYSISAHYNNRRFGIFYSYIVRGGSLENLSKHRYGTVNLLFRF